MWPLVAVWAMLVMSGDSLHLQGRHMVQCMESLSRQYLRGYMDLIMHWDAETQSGRPLLREDIYTSLPVVLMAAARAASLHNRSVIVYNMNSFFRFKLSKTMEVQHELGGVKADNVVVALSGRAIIHRRLLAMQLSQLREHPAWSSVGRVVLLLYQIVSLREVNAARVVLQRVWENTRAPDTIAAVVYGDGIKYYKWHPYQKECDQVKTVKLIDWCSDGSMVFGEKLFVKTVNLHGCTLLTGTHPHPPYILQPADSSTTDFTQGVEVRLLYTLAEHFNFKISYVSLSEDINPYEVYGEDGQPAGYHAMLQDYNLDLFISGLEMQQVRGRFGECVDSYMDDEMVWVVPSPAEVPVWKNMFHVFMPYAWCLQCAVLLISMLAAFLISRSTARVSGVYGSLESSAVAVWASTLSHRHQAPRSTPLRFFFTFHSLHSFVMVNLYLSSLYVFSQHLRYYPPYRSPTNAVDAGLVTYLLPDGSGSSYNRSHHSLWNKILQPDNYVISDDQMDALANAAGHGALGMMRENAARYLIAKYYTASDGRAAVQIIKDDFDFLRITFYMPKGHPMLQPFRKKVNQLKEAGMIVYWLKQTLQRPDHETNKGGFTPITIENMQTAFILLLAMLTVSTLVFMIEVIYINAVTC